MLDLLLAAATLATGIGSDKKNREATKETNAAELAQREQIRQDIIKYGDRAIDAIGPGYDFARNILREQQKTIPSYLQQTSLPQFELIDKSSLAGQQVALGGLMAQNQAILGAPIDYSALQPRSLDFDYRGAVAESAPTPIDLSAIENAMALQGEKVREKAPVNDWSILTENLQPGQSWSRNLTPEQLASLTPYQRGVIQQFNLVGDIMSDAASGSFR
jgi:hypothetical protein